MKNPITVLEKIDAAANHVAQIRLALMVGDKAHALQAVENAERLLFNATTQIEDESNSKVAHGGATVENKNKPESPLGSPHC